MNTIQYRPGYFIHETFSTQVLSALGKPYSVRVQTPDGQQLPVKSIHAAKCLITRMRKSAQFQQLRSWGVAP